jgi:hypothetical protein
VRKGVATGILSRREVERWLLHPAQAGTKGVLMSATKIYLGPKVTGAFAITEIEFTNKVTKNVVTSAYLIWVESENLEGAAKEGNELMSLLTQDQGELECTSVKFSPLAMPTQVIKELAHRMVDEMRGGKESIETMTSINEGHPA